MSNHSDLFVAHCEPAIKSHLGDEITYGATACMAQVGPVDVLEDETGAGLAHRQEREVTVFKSDIATPAIEDEVTIGSDTWTVTKIVRECESHTVLRCMLVDAREVSRRAYRR